MSDGHGLSASELELLTDEERAGLESGEFDEDGDEGDNGDDGDDGGQTGRAAFLPAAAGEGDEDGDEGDDGDDGAKADDDAAAAAAAAATAVADDEDEGAAPPPAGDRIDVAAAQDRITAIGTEQAALEAQLDDGEITTKEFLAANKKLEREESDLSGKVSRQEEAEQAISQTWFADVGKFLDKNPDLKANNTRLQSFDAVVRRVTGNPENATLSNRKQLELAHNQWREEMGIPASGKAGAAPGAQEGKAAQKAPKPRTEIPPTLHNVPSADMTNSDDSKFAYLDGLMDRDPIAFEKALSNLSEADQQDYLGRA